MTVRLVSLALAMTILSACSQGQKGRVQLKNEMDSVSYSIGADIGANFKRSKLDSVNIDAISMGLRDGLDSTTILDENAMRASIEGYMAKTRASMQAEERAAGEANKAEGEAFLAENGKKKGVTTTASGLQYEVVTMGSGPKPTVTDKVKVHYTGTLLDGTEFDSSAGGEPIEFTSDQVIAGWGEALQLMPTGSKFKFYIPSELAYGPSRGPGGQLPPNSVLVFDLELLGIVK